MSQQHDSTRVPSRRRALRAGVICLAVLSIAAPVAAQTAPAVSPPATVTGPPSAPAAPVGEVPGPPGSDAAQSAPAPAAADLPSALLPHDLSPWGMFMNADKLVKAVMIGLAFASVVTWTIALAKWFELAAFKVRLRKLHQAIAGARSLAEAQGRVGRGGSAAVRLVRAAVLELERSPDRSDREGIRERLAATIDRIEAMIGRQLGRGTGILGTIGATAPFVGLFGTVWGIMNSFIGISKAHTTNLAVVAPGIAEALLATALGLAAAIPAVVIYNYLARSIAGCKALFANTSTEVLNLTSREIAQPAERRRAPLAPARLSAESSA